MLLHIQAACHSCSHQSDVMAHALFRTFLAYVKQGSQQQHKTCNKLSPLYPYCGAVFVLFLNLDGNLGIPRSFLGWSFPSCYFTCHVMGLPCSPSAIEWYSFPLEWGLYGRWYIHKSRSILNDPKAHRFIQTTYPWWRVVVLVVIVEWSIVFDIHHGTCPQRMTVLCLFNFSLLRWFEGNSSSTCRCWVEKDSFFWGNWFCLQSIFMAKDSLEAYHKEIAP